jgi:starch synthase (maltosyl-transferring)
LDGRCRVVIENVKPEIDCGLFPIKRVVGEKVVVRADIFADGHEEVSAALLYRKEEEEKWQEVPMSYLMNDRWEGEFIVTYMGGYVYTLKGWVDHFRTWQKDLKKKFEAGHEISVELMIGAELVDRAVRRAPKTDREKLKEFSGLLRDSKKEPRSRVSAATDEVLTSLMAACPDQGLASGYSKKLRVTVDRKKALFSSWYEMFPRSCDSTPAGHGRLKDCEALLPEIAEMGFDVLYLPPIHPIGKTNRKGKNNLAAVGPDAPGSPWAIGSPEGGHKAIHPRLGTMEDFERFAALALDHGLELAMDLAFQCSPDHPYIREHPEWFRWRPDNTIQHAENPPKRYEDIVPFDFECAAWEALWEELKDVVLFWAGKGVRIFRVDNPHTKPLAFWDWLILEVKKDFPGAIFLAEAFTRPKLMYRLAKGGFTQSYTYFTWRNSKQELMEYVEELTRTDLREYFRPNFWPNTPDILNEYLHYGGRPSFIIRLVLAATLSSNYGLYGPAFELMESETLPGKEEYQDSEKYEIRRWDRRRSDSLRYAIARINLIRKENPALQGTSNVQFCETDNNSVISYVKTTDDRLNVLLTVVSLDPFRRQSCKLRLPLPETVGAPGRQYLMHDLLSEDKFIWQGEWNTVELDPQLMPARVFRVHTRLRREEDFDYFM